jgi:hypothetical protein
MHRLLLENTPRTFTTNPLNTSDREYVAINDGTFRITVRWKPAQYEEMKTDSDKWNHAVVEILQAIMNHTSSQLNIVKWGSKQLQSDHIVAVSDLQPTMLRQLCSPKISYINSHQMIVFGICVCATDKNFSTGKWLNDNHVKLSLANYLVELNISNSTCDSGNMVTAGIILLKHPVYTHRLLFSPVSPTQSPIEYTLFRHWSPQTYTQWHGKSTFGG